MTATAKATESARDGAGLLFSIPARRFQRDASVVAGACVVVAAALATLS
eukprot:CAMPEP_0174851600 /NCGR_PEP_ID=MMETSP1114-20130205/23278_1 /TAXON_ID=312471 /ORGANISM="Neobodo designis, Strain CCAP 1951/1" /LENGTH=48 /DNA_ID= /DNA_START= /DNA_END= /DNA_ORIENTATION=